MYSKTKKKIPYFSLIVCNARYGMSRILVQGCVYLKKKRKNLVHQEYDISFLCVDKESS